MDRIIPRSIVIKPDSINFYDERLQFEEIQHAVDGSIEMLYGCVVPGLDLYVNGAGLLRTDLTMNMLANPIIEERALIQMAIYGGPLGTIVLVPEDGKRFPFSKIENLYLNYDDEWREEWQKAKEQWDRCHSQ